MPEPLTKLEIDMTTSEADQQQPVLETYRQLELLNDRLHIICRLLSKPAACMATPEVMDVVHLAVERVYSLYESLAEELRQKARLDA